MSSPARPTGPALDGAAALRLRRTVELTRLLETTAYFAREWYGARYLIVDRTGDPALPAVLATVDSRLVDLWELDPILWDDAFWAAQRFVDVGEVLAVHPVLHRT